MKQLRLSLVGFGAAGQGFAELLVTKRAFVRQRYGVDLTLVGVANARHGFLYREGGLHVPTLLELTAKRRPLTEHPGIARWRGCATPVRTCWLR